MEDLIMISRRAIFSKNVTDSYNSARNNLELGLDYYNKILSSEILEPKFVDFHNSNYLKGIISELEIFLNTILTEIYTCYPKKLENKQIDYNQLEKIGTMYGIIVTLTEKEVNNIMYLPIPAIIDKFIKSYSIKDSIDENLIGIVNEVKCTRDIYTHSTNVANDIYIRKSKQYARVNADEKLILNKTYLINSTDKIVSLINKLYDIIPKSYMSKNKAICFKEMWSFSSLQRVMPFEEAWKIENHTLATGIDNFVPVPSERAAKWLWSYSEKQLFDFFMYIFNRQPVDIPSLIKRWDIDSNDGLIVISWLNSPFYF